MTLELLRSLNLGAVAAFAIACQLLAIVVLVEKLKAVDFGATNRSNKDAREVAARHERKARAAYGLMIDLSLYLLTGEIVAAFVVLSRGI